MPKRKHASIKRREPADLLFDGKVGAKFEFKRLNTNVKDWMEEVADKHKTYKKLTNKTRGALNDYLQEVYKTALNSAKKIGELKAYAKKHKLPFDKNTSIFGFILKMHYGDSGPDRRRVSEQAQALRYLYEKDVDPKDVATKLKKFGGVRGCSRKFTKLLPKDPKEKKANQKKAESKANAVGETSTGPKARARAKKRWAKLKGKQPIAVYRLSKGKLRKDRYAFFGYVSKSGILTVHDATAIKTTNGRQLLATRFLS